MNLKDFAELAGVDRGTIRRHLAKGTIKGMKKVFYYWDIPEEEIENLNKNYRKKKLSPE